MRWITGNSTGRGRGDIREAVRTTRFGSYNTCDFQNGGLKSALCGIYQADINLGVFQEKKFTRGIYARELGGYRVLATKEPRSHRGGVAVFYHEADNFEF